MPVEIGEDEPVWTVYDRSAHTSTVVHLDVVCRATPDSVISFPLIRYFHHMLLAICIVLSLLSRNRRNEFTAQPNCRLE